MTGHWTPTALHVRNGEKRMSSALMCIVTRQASMPMCRDVYKRQEDKFGVKYSKDWKRLLSAPRRRSLSGKYSIRKGVKVIGNNADVYKRQSVAHPSWFTAVTLT